MLYFKQYLDFFSIIQLTFAMPMNIILKLYISRTFYPMDRINLILTFSYSWIFALYLTGQYNRDKVYFACFLCIYYL